MCGGSQNVVFMGPICCTCWTAHRSVSIDQRERILEMATIVDLVVSRRKTIAKLERELAAYQDEILKHGATSPAGVALANIAKISAQRLDRVKAELAGLEAALEPAKPSPQLELGAKPKKS